MQLVTLIAECTRSAKVKRANTTLHERTVVIFSELPESVQWFQGLAKSMRPFHGQDTQGIHLEP